MAQISVIDLPLMAYAELTSNDRLLIIDDGTLKQFTWGNLLTFIQSNVQGPKGDQGVAGKDGRDGINGTNGTNGANGLSAYQVAVNNGFVGTVTEWLASLQGQAGADGADGANGWTPILAVASDGNRRVIAVTSWTGGSGTPPPTGYYGPSGIVSNIANAVDIRGIQGVQGLTGPKGDTGSNGLDGANGASAYDLAVAAGFVGTIDDWLASLEGAQGPKGDKGDKGDAGAGAVTAASIAANGTLTLTLNDASTVVSNTPNKTKGFARYADGQYVGGTFFFVDAGTTVNLPNNKATVVESLPTGVTTFYDSTKLQLADTSGLYEVQVQLKLASKTTADMVKVSIVDNSGTVVFEDDFTTRGDSFPIVINATTLLVGSASVASGLTVKLRTYGQAYDVFDIVYTVAKLF